MSRIIAVIAVACACSTTPPPPAPVPCVVHLSGAIDDTVTGATCTVSPADGGLSFSAHAAGQMISSFDANIALPAPSGVFSVQSSPSWSASATAGDAGCAFTAGSAETPPGSFSLTLGSDAGADAHGVLTLVLYIHAPPLTDCGPRDVENVELTF